MNPVHIINKPVTAAGTRHLRVCLRQASGYSQSPGSYLECPLQSPNKICGRGDKAEIALQPEGRPAMGQQFRKSTPDSHLHEENPAKFCCLRGTAAAPIIPGLSNPEASRLIGLLEGDVRLGEKARRMAMRNRNRSRVIKDNLQAWVEPMAAGRWRPVLKKVWSGPDDKIGW